MPDLNKIIDDLSKLTVAEAADLSKQLEEKWGVTPMAAAAPAAAGGGVILLVALVVLMRKRNGSQEDDVVTLEVRKPLKGPPPRSQPSGNSGPLSGPPQMAVEETAGVQQEPNAVELETVESYAQLPGGGDYRYDEGQTIYSGTGIGTWKQNPDQSFTRFEE